MEPAVGGQPEPVAPGAKLVCQGRDNPNGANAFAPPVYRRWPRPNSTTPPRGTRSPPAASVASTSSLETIARAGAAAIAWRHQLYEPDVQRPPCHERSELQDAVVVDTLDQDDVQRAGAEPGDERGLDARQASRQRSRRVIAAYLTGSSVSRLMLTRLRPASRNWRATGPRSTPLVVMERSKPDPPAARGVAGCAPVSPECAGVARLRRRGQRHSREAPLPARQRSRRNPPRQRRSPP